MGIMNIIHTVYRSAIGAETDEQVERYRAACEETIEAALNCTANVRVADDGPSASDTRIDGATCPAHHEAVHNMVHRICDRIWASPEMWA